MGQTEHGILITAESQTRAATDESVRDLNKVDAAAKQVAESAGQAQEALKKMAGATEGIKAPTSQQLTSNQLSQAHAGGAAVAWNPYIAAVKRAEMEAAKLAETEKRAAEEAARATAKAKTEAEHLPNALRAVGSASKQAFGEMRSGALSAGMAAQGLNSHLKNLDTSIGNLKGQSFDNLSAGLDQVRNVGLGIAGAAGLGAAGIIAGVRMAGNREVQMKSIEALSGSPEAAKQVFKTADNQSLESVFSLNQLVGASKTLSAGRIFSGRNLRAVDDLAAVKQDEGMTPAEVASAFSRLKSGDFGEAFQRFRELGINRQDLEKKGLKFDGANQFQGTADQAIEGVVAVIEEKFGGLSKKLATETMEGALSNLGDAFQRTVISIESELIPAVTWGTKVLTGVTSFFADLPEPLRKVIAYGGVAVTAFGLLAGGGLVFVAMAGQAVLGLISLNAALAPTGAEAGIAAIGVEGLGGALTGVLLPALGTVAVAIGLIAVAAAATYVAVKGASDASSQSAAEMEAHWGWVGKFWTKAGDALTAIWNHPLLAWLHAGSELNSDLSVASDNGAGDDLFKRAQAAAAKKGKTLTRAQWDALQADGDTTVQEVRDREAKAVTDTAAGKKANEDDAAAMLKAKFAAMAASGSAGATAGGNGVSPAFAGMAGPGGQTGVIGSGSFAGLAGLSEGEAEIRSTQADIEALQNKIHETQDKDIKKALQEDLRHMQQHLAHLRQGVADDKRLTEAQKREAAEKKRAAEKADKAADRAAKQNAAVEAARVGDELETQIVAMQVQRDAMKKSQRRQIDYDIEVLKAKQTLAKANETIAGMDDDDPAGKDAASRKANLDYRAALQQAALRRDAPMVGMNAIMARLRSGGHLGDRGFGGGVGAFADAALARGERTVDGKLIGEGFDPNAYTTGFTAQVGGGFARNSVPGTVGFAETESAKYSAREKGRKIRADGKEEITLAILIERSGSSFSNIARLGVVPK